MTDEGRRGLLAVWVLVGWTLFVWVNRIRNVVVDPDLDGAGRLAPLAMSVAFVVAAAAVALLAVRGRGRALTIAVRVLAALTAAVWIVRSIGIALGGHAIGFVVVHLVLAAVSIGVAAWAVGCCEGSHKLPVTA